MSEWVPERFPLKRKGLEFMKQVESKTNQFEIVLKSLARFRTQFSDRESFKLVFALKVRYKSRNSLTINQKLEFLRSERGSRAG